jgi:hypothetical protein
MALMPLTGFAQGQGQGQRQDRGAHEPQHRAQVERGQSDFDRDRMRDRDRIHQSAQDRDRVQDRTHAPDNAGNGGEGIYGQELMSVQEQNRYREQLRLVESDPEQKTQLQAQHREEMQIRAREQGVTLADPPEAEKAK